ncbi:MAG TPA: hypothetical protein VGK20_16275 [Candidatus Binatia bacterium]
MSSIRAASIRRRLRIAPAATMALAILLSGLAAASVAAAAQKCGDRDNSGTVTASDALGVLKVSVGAAQCDPCVCDVNHSGTVTASDALVVLKFAVGQPVTLSCNSCTPLCQSSQPPQCGGTCNNGLVCAETPDTNGMCDCVPACTISAVPACGGSCEGADAADSLCNDVTFAAGNHSIDRCVCLPPGAKACGDSSAPTCGGVCQPGHACTNHSGKCQCDSVAAPVVACGQSSTPTCGGTCPDGFICTFADSICECIQSDGSQNACESAEAPVCGAACPDTKTCARDFLVGCKCFHPCEISNAPACGGSCNSGTCTHATATIKGANSTVDYCLCL